MAKILLVEDDKSLREIYGVRLMAEGYQIVSAGDGEEALAMAIKERPDLIVSDVMMPKISGFDMLDILRSTTETKTIKVIMMTALSSDDQRARGEALGADRYLVKSQVGIEDVVRTVHDVLSDGVAPAAQPTDFAAAPAATVAYDPLPVPPVPVAAPVAAAPVALQQPEPVASPAPAVPTIPPPVYVPPAAPVSIPLPPAPANPYEVPAAPQPAPQPAAQPVPPPVYSAPVQQPTPFPSQFTQPQPAPQAPAQPAPQPGPQYQTQPLQQQPQPQPQYQQQANTLPAPTAPFSSPRPASLGDRVINPLNPIDQPNGVDIAAQMSQELNGPLQAAQPTQSYAPPAAPQPLQQPPLPPTPQTPGI